MEKYQVRLDSRYDWKKNTKKYNNDMKDAGHVPSMAKDKTNVCGKACTSEDMHLNARIFEDRKPAREDTIDYEDFLKILLHMADAYNPDRSNFVYKQLTGLQLEQNRIKSIEYSFVQVAKTTGGGGESFYETQRSMTYGRSTESAVEESVMVKVTARQDWSVMGQNGGIEIEGSWSFSEATERASSFEKTETETIHMVTTEPTTVWQKRVTIRYWDNPENDPCYIAMSTVMTHGPDEDPVNRRVIYNWDQTILSDEVSKAGTGLWLDIAQ